MYLKFWTFNFKQYFNTVSKNEIKFWKNQNQFPKLTSKIKLTISKTLRNFVKNLKDHIHGQIWTKTPLLEI